MAQLLKNKFVKRTNGLDFSRTLFPYEKRHSTNLLAGAIVPVHTQFLYPGMSPDYNFGAIIESAPLISTNLDNIYVDVVCVWSPLRLVMTDFNEWLGESHTNAFTINRNITFPKITRVDEELPLQTPVTSSPFYKTTRAYFVEHALGPHLGFRYHGKNNAGYFDATLTGCVPAGSIFKKGISVLPSRVYENNYNYIFRNENIQPPILIDKTSVVGSNDATYRYGLGPIRFANKLKDVFVRATPAPSLLDVSIALDQYLAPIGIVSSGSATVTNSEPNTTFLPGTYSQGDFISLLTSNTAHTQVADPFVADLSALTVNRMYYALMEQRFANKMMKGRRATEFYENFFGIRSSDAGHDEPTLICHKRFSLNISQVITTANSTDIDGNDQPVGSKGAFSVTGISGSLIKNFMATEHGYLQTYVIIRGQQSYSSGIDKHLGYDGLLDTYIPEFDHIGPVGIEGLEISDQFNVNAVNFGFTNAWYQERYQVSDVVGIMEPSEPLAYKTLASDYSDGSAVVISDDFIKFAPTIIDRIFLFPVCGLGTRLSTFTSTVTGATCGYDRYGEPMDSNRYQFLIQFVVKGQLAAVMSPDSEPLQLRI